MRSARWFLASAAFWAATPAAAGGFDRDVLDAINAARQHPQATADALRRYRATFDGRVAHAHGDPVGVITYEGVAAVDEAIAFLEHQLPLPALDDARLLSAAARDHADEQGPEGLTGHVSPNGEGPGARVRARGGGIYVGETIAYGERDAADMVRSLIVDDGVRGRGHRTLIFSAQFRYAGVGCGAHARYGNICVVDYSGTRDGRWDAPRTVIAAVSSPAIAR